MILFKHGRIGLTSCWHSFTFDWKEQTEEKINQVLITEKVNSNLAFGLPTVQGILWPFIHFSFLGENKIEPKKYKCEFLLSLHFVLLILLLQQSMLLFKDCSCFKINNLCSGIFWNLVFGFLFLFPFPWICNKTWRCQI